MLQDLLYHSSREEYCNDFKQFQLMNLANNDGGKKYLKVYVCRDPTQQWVESLQTL